jgi:predicted branched-subunit amino acid permease
MPPAHPPSPHEPDPPDPILPEPSLPESNPAGDNAPSSASSEFWTGVRDELPLQLGVIPFGLVFGVLGIASGLTPLQTILMSSILFGGASQVVFAQLWATGAPPVFVGASVAVINMRHVLYSASVAPYLRQLPLHWRIPLAYLLTDEAYAVSIKRFLENPANPFKHYHLLGTGMTLWVLWQITTTIGVFASTTIPEELSLGFAIPLTFIAIVAPAIRTRPDLLACITSGGLALAGHALPWNSGLLIAAMGGILAGWLAHRFNQARVAQ